MHSVTESKNYIWHGCLIYSQRNLIMICTCLSNIYVFYCTYFMDIKALSPFFFFFFFFCRASSVFNLRSFFYVITKIFEVSGGGDGGGGGYTHSLTDNQ
jgi:hypothetical protein